MQQPQFGLVTRERVLGMLKATGSTDPDVLLAAKEEFSYGYRILKFFGIWGLVTGVLATLLIVLAFIGIPLLIFGWWALRRSKRNVRLIESTFAEYVASVSGKTAVPSGAKAGVQGLVALCALALIVPEASAQQSVPPQFIGDWVAANVTCTAPLRFRATARQLTLINGRDTASYGDIAIPSGFFGPDYNGISVVLMPDINTGEPPFTAYFNADEKKGVTKLDIYTDMKGPMNPQVAAIQGRAKRLSQRFPLHQVALKKCPLGSAGGTRAAAPVKTPSICGGNPRCTEVTPFAATITDFRTSIAGSDRIVSMTVRFQNKSARPLILGYLQGSGLLLDDQGNRYGIYGRNGIRGIGEVTNSTFDPKFVLQPGEASDARFEFGWRPSQQNQIYGTVYDLELAVREIDPLAGDQYRLGKEHAFQVRGLAPGTATAGLPADAPAVTPVSDRGPATPAPAEAADACGGKVRCYSAGPFTAEVGQITTSSAGYWRMMRLNVKLRNVTTAPMVLAYRAGSGTGSDDQGNRWSALDHKGAVRGIGLVSRASADPQFVLNPGASRNVTVEYSTYMGKGVILGTVWATDFSLEQLEILPSRQVRSVREYTVSFADLTASGPSATSAAAQNQNLVNEVKKLLPKKK